MNESSKENLKELLEIDITGGMILNLGILESLRTKNLNFWFLKDIMHNLVKGWSSKYLSKSGKE